jgi:DNA-binding response OmpR family regulator
VSMPGIAADRNWSTDARPASVLIVEDDAGIATQLARGLQLAGYETSCLGAGRHVPGSPAVDVVLLDLGLPDVDGVEVCRQLRARSGVAIIVVTARGEESDQVLALDAGADDYLVKPFGLSELLARIRAVLRRRRPQDDEVLRCGDLAVDLRACKVTLAGREIALTPKEFDILECLASDPGRVATRQDILDQAWDSHWYGPMKALDVHIAALRRKLGEPRMIETVYGRGFRLIDPR